MTTEPRGAERGQEAMRKQDLAERGLALGQIVKQASQDLNGTYLYALTGSIHVVSDGADWSQKIVTLPEGDTKTEASISIVQAIKKGWYVRIDPAPQPTEGASEP